MKLLFKFFVISIMSLQVVFAQQADTSRAENEAKTHYLLGIVGYNYTNRVIDGFSVDGAGGGHVRVSSPTNGGSGTVCCVLFSKQPKWPIQVLIRWQHGGCRVYDEDRTFGHNRYYYKEKKVNLERGTSKHPTEFAVHFYPDGSVRARLSDSYDDPLLKLPESRALKNNFPECKDGDPVEYL
jgi:hypothetical protein